MTTLLRASAVLLAFSGLALVPTRADAGAHADGPAPAAAKPAAESATLHTGDPAPALSIAKWVQGGPITAFEPGKVYVVEFWATWCGPCLASSPHLTKLQAAHQADGLTIIGVTREDPRNSLAKVEQTVRDRADVMGYPIAWDDQQKTWAAYMAAAKQRGIPTAFVVDRAGKIAFIGHPMLLDLVLPKVLAGAYTPERDGPAVAAAEDAMDALGRKLAGTGKLPPREALAAIDAFAKQYPTLAEQFEADRYFALAAQNDPAAATLGTAIVARGERDKSFATLLEVSDGLLDADRALPKPDLNLALRAAEGANRLTGGVRTSALASLARVHAARGDKAQAIDLMTKAVENAPDSAKARFQKELDALKSG